jgi:hypothetical protein
MIISIYVRYNSFDVNGVLLFHLFILLLSVLLLLLDIIVKTSSKHQYSIPVVNTPIQIHVHAFTPAHIQTHQQHPPPPPTPPPLSRRRGANQMELEIKMIGTRWKTTSRPSAKLYVCVEGGRGEGV